MQVNAPRLQLDFRWTAEPLSSEPVTGMSESLAEGLVSRFIDEWTRSDLEALADGSEHGYCVFRTGAAALVVEAVPKDAAPADQILVGRFTGLSFEVPSAAVAYRDLRSRGVAFTGEPEKQSWGGTLAIFKDPAGNELQICELPRG